MQINNVTMSGRLTNNVDYSATKNGTPRAKFTLANNRKDNVEYFPVIAFSKVADYCRDYLHKGQRLTLVGRLHHYATKDNNGNYKDYWSIVANSLDPIHAKSNHQSKSEKKLFKENNILSKRLDKISKKVGVKS